VIALATPPCTAADLRPLPARLQGATGSMLGFVPFRNVSSRRCSVGGRPRLTLLLGPRVLRTRRGALDSSIGVRPLRMVAAGGRTGVYVQWSNWCGAWPANGLVHTIRLRIVLTTGVRLTARARTGRPRCDAPAAGSVVYVSAFGATQ
jgi:hypothetical protein